MKHQDSISHLKSHLSKDKLEQMRNIALTTAGFSAAIIFLLSQVKNTDAYSSTSLWASIISMVVWTFGFQYISTYLLHGERVYQHINFSVITAVSALGYMALFVAVVATVWQLSVFAGVALAALGLILAVAVVIHTKAVEQQCNESNV